LRSAVRSIGSESRGPRARTARALDREGRVPGARELAAERQVDLRAEAEPRDLEPPGRVVALVAGVRQVEAPLEGDARRLRELEVGIDEALRLERLERVLADHEARRDGEAEIELEGVERLLVALPREDAALLGAEQVLARLVDLEVGGGRRRRGRTLGARVDGSRLL
jgi:hypothetical protein